MLAVIASIEGERARTAATTEEEDMLWYGTVWNGKCRVGGRKNRSEAEVFETRCQNTETQDGENPKPTEFRLYISSVRVETQNGTPYMGRICHDMAY
jgi:hypothetical protein